MSRLAYLEGLMEGAAISCKNPEYEVRHLNDVLKHMNNLSETRALDPYMCRLVALGHDIGRVRLGVEGKAHAKASAKWMKTFLKGTALSGKERKQILKAIAKHNQKHKIHSPLAEAIKDADTLAHEDENLLTEQGIYEQYRMLAMNSGEPAIWSEETDKWQIQLEALLADLKETIQSQTLMMEEPALWVHRTRILARKLRSILWILQQPEVALGNTHLIKANRQLKRMGKLLSRPRLLYVVCTKIGEHHSLYERFSVELEAMYEELRHSDTLKHIIDSITVALDQVNLEAIETYQLSHSVKVMMSDYLKACEGKGRFKLDKLHQLRIAGKRIVYLSDLELIRVEPAVLLNAVYALHKLIGRHRDLHEIDTLLNEKTCSKPVKRLEQDIKAELFLINKLKGK